jgi:putative transposase
MPRRKEPRIPDAVLDQLLADADPQTVFDPNGLLDALKKVLAERVLNAEMDHHLAGEEPGNRRNGYGKKTVITDTGQIELEVPRDRQARFDPQLIAKYQRRFPGFDDKIISMYARGMSTREIVGHLRDLYRIEVSPDLISAVTDAVLEEVAAWQARPLEPVYPLIFFDALRVKIRNEGLVRNKAVHLALGVRADGTKEILGLWLEQNEGAKFWLRVMNELKNRGVEDVLIAVVDGLKGFPEAITAVFPQTTVQTCIVHTIRTQSTILNRGILASEHWTVQRDDMTDLQTVLMNDDAFDDQLQDSLPIGKAGLVQTAVQARAERGEIGCHRLRFDLVLA